MSSATRLNRRAGDKENTSDDTRTPESEYVGGPEEGEKRERVFSIVRAIPNRLNASDLRVVTCSATLPASTATLHLRCSHAVVAHERKGGTSNSTLSLSFFLFFLSS